MNETILPEPVEDIDQKVLEHPLNLAPRPLHSYPTLRILFFIIALAIIGMVGAVFFNYYHYSSQDKTRKSDLEYISSLAQDYFNFNNFYPTLEQINSQAFSAFMPNRIDIQKLVDPSGKSDKLSNTPSISAYSYQPLPLYCDNQQIKCTNFKLVAILSNGKKYIVYGK